MKSAAAYSMKAALAFLIDTLKAQPPASAFSTKRVEERAVAHTDY